MGTEQIGMPDTMRLLEKRILDTPFLCHVHSPAPCL